MSVRQRRRPVSENQSEQGFPVHGLLQRGIDFGRRVRIHGSTC